MQNKTKNQAQNSRFQIPDSAFTLIELLVVISIIGILIGLSIFGLQGARTSSRDAKRKADLELVRSGIEIYKSDCNVYPVSTGFGANAVDMGLVLGTKLTGNDTSSANCLSTNTYINQVPLDPTSPALFYAYYSADGTKYNICAHLEQVDASVWVSCDDSGNPTSCGVDPSSVCNYKVVNP